MQLKVHSVSYGISYGYELRIAVHSALHSSALHQLASCCAWPNSGLCKPASSCATAHLLSIQREGSVVGQQLSSCLKCTLHHRSAVISAEMESWYACRLTGQAQSGLALQCALMLS